MSDQKKLRRLNEALRFLTDKKLKTWQDGGRKGKIFNIAIQAFQKNESDENPGETMIKEMIARKRKARMEKKEQEGIKVQELAKSIVENNDGKSIKKDNDKPRRRSRNEQKKTRNSLLKPLKSRSKSQSPLTTSKSRSRANSSSSSRSSSSDSRRSSVSVERKPKKKISEGLLQLPESKQRKGTRRLTSSSSNHQLTSSNLDLSVVGSGSACFSSSEEGGASDIEPTASKKSHKNTRLSLKMSKLKFDSLDKLF